MVRNSLLMPPEEFVSVCAQYTTLHQRIRTNMQNMGTPAVNDSAIYKAALRIAELARVAEPPRRAAPKHAKRKPKSKRVNTSNAAEGRRAVARGDRPPMKEAIATVMGKASMGAPAVVEGLKKRDWLPNSKDPQQYVSYLLSSYKDVFKRLKRGLYKVRSGTKKAPPKAVVAKKAPKNFPRRKPQKVDPKAPKAKPVELRLAAVSKAA